jgi:hypothetical protein
MSFSRPIQWFYFIFFLLGYSVLATPLLMSLNLYFLEVSGLEPRELP